MQPDESRWRGLRAHGAEFLPGYSLRRSVKRRRWWNTTAFLEWLQFRAAHCERQFVNGNIFRVPVNFQLEPLFENRLQHWSIHNAPTRSGLGLGIDRITLGIDP